MSNKKIKTEKLVIDVSVNMLNLDKAEEKANHLVELLKEAKELIDSLGSTTIINNNN